MDVDTEELVRDTARLADRKKQMPLAWHLLVLRASRALKQAAVMERQVGEGKPKLLVPAE
jgi:hypothetical protein